MQAMNMQVVSNQRILTPLELSRYFERPPNVTKLMIIGSILLGIVALCGLSSVVTNPQNVLGFVVIFIFFSIPLDIGILILMNYNLRKRPTDEEYEAWVNSWRSSIQPYGLQKLGLTSQEVSGTPLHVRGIVWPSSPEAKTYHNMAFPVQVKRGKDGRVHASINRFTFFYPAEHYIAVFTGDVNALHPFRYEGTQMYYYNDIVGVETNGLVLSIEGTSVGMQKFSLRVSRGQAIGASVIDVDREVEDTIKDLRVMLRNKKFGNQGGGRMPAGY